MNTGVQRSGATPLGAFTTTSPPGKISFGEDRPKKDLTWIVAAHEVPYVATASVAFPFDYIEKMKKAISIEGPAYIHVHIPCPTGWGFPSGKTIEIGKLAVDTGMWVLYEIESGEVRVTYKPKKKIEVKKYLKMQRRFKHLKDDIIERIQTDIDTRWKELWSN